MHFMRLAAAAMIVATPAVARAQIVAYDTASSPIVITGLSLKPAYAPAAIGGEATEAPQFITALDSGYITLKFVNTRKVAATRVTFSASNGRYMQNIVDKGTFSSGVQINHTFAIISGLSELSSANWKVAEVDFADSTAWHSTDLDATATPIAQANADPAAAPAASLESNSPPRGLDGPDTQRRRMLFRNQGTSL